MILVVGAIIVDSLDAPTRVLAARRSSGTGAGGWEFPGGKVEAGERPIDALHRELAEELDVEVEIGQELRDPEQPVWPIDERYVMRTWFAEIRTGAPTPTGSHAEVRWLGVNDLFGVRWLPADLAVVEQVRPWLRETTRHGTGRT